MLLLQSQALTIDLFANKLLQWEKSIMGVTKYEELPQEAKDYVEFIETFIGVKVQYIG